MLKYQDLATLVGTTIITVFYPKIIYRAEGGRGTKHSQVHVHTPVIIKVINAVYNLAALHMYTAVVGIVWAVSLYMYKYTIRGLYC